MAKKSPSTPKNSVVATAFEEFLKYLAEDRSISAEVVEQLRKSLIEKQDFSPEGLRSALFPEKPAS